MTQTPQSYSQHAKIDPQFHYFLLPIVAINVIVVAYLLFRYPGWGGAWLLVISIALLIGVLRLRTYATQLQDRIIRVEERLRMEQLLPEPMRARIPELTTSQLIGLRFASDAELPALVMRTLDEKLDRVAIKKAITEWRADYQRV